jgi:uncharacterized protein YrrD
MQYKSNADVLSSEGKKIGRLERVVVDPQSKNVTDIVIKKGLLFTKDKVVPADRVETATEDRVMLKKGAEAPEELPDFEEKHYLPVDDPDTFFKEREYARPTIWYYPLPGVGWWRTYPAHSKPAFVSRTERNIPEGTVPVEEGAQVVSSDGHHVGDVERVYTEPEEQRVTHLLLSKGLFSKEKKLLPTAWVDDIFEKQIRLTVDAALIEGLPPYPPPDTP